MTKMTEKEIYFSKDPSVPKLDVDSPYTKIAGEIIKDLENCSPGTKGWREFEKICKKIIEFSLEPCFYPFDKIEEQTYSWDKVDRTDYRIPNNTRTDRLSTFWEEIKNTYDSHNIVVECKNHTDYLEKEEIVGTSAYTWYTNGKFRLIFSRKGVNDKGLNILRHLFTTEQKLILVCSDKDLIDLIKSRVEQIDPEVLLIRIRNRILKGI